MICDRCNGNKKIVFKSKHGMTYTQHCFKCDGSGKIDWITKIFEHDQPKDIWKSTYLRRIFNEERTY